MLVQITGLCGRMVFRLANYTFQFETSAEKKSQQGLGAPSRPKGRDGWCERRDGVQKRSTLLRIRANLATLRTSVAVHFREKIHNDVTGGGVEGGKSLHKVLAIFPIFYSILFLRWGAEGGGLAGSLLA